MKMYLSLFCQNYDQPVGIINIQNKNLTNDPFLSCVLQLIKTIHSQMLVVEKTTVMLTGNFLKCVKMDSNPGSSLDFQAVICIFLLCFFLLQGTKYSWWPQWSIQFTLISPGFSLCINILEIGGAGGAIYQHTWLLHHTAWSAQEGMSTFQGLGTQSNPGSRERQQAGRDNDLDYSALQKYK